MLQGHDTLRAWLSCVHVRADGRWVDIRTLVIALIAAACLSLLGWVTHYEVRQATQNVLSEGFHTILEADATALEIWLENEKATLRSWASEWRLRKLAADLVRLAASNPDSRETLLTASELAELRWMLEAASNEDDLGFAVVDRSGLLVATHRDETVGQQLTPTGMTILTRIFRGEAVVTRPYRLQDLLSNINVALDTPIMAVGVPIRDTNDRIIASLVRRLRPEKDFTRILAVARPGTSGDTYAFDEHGTMLTETRHLQQLKTIGLLPASAGSSILQVQLRDPGTNLTTRPAKETLLTTRPLTTLVAQATAEQEGLRVILDPYRDYRGIPVVGAYLWLSDYGFGIATEVSAEEAFVLLRPVRSSFLVLLTALLIFTLLLIASSYFAQRLRREMRQIRRLGQYNLERKIGAGAMGQVYLAQHALLRRPTAVKLIQASDVASQDLLRFEREAQLTSQLTHPNTIEIYDYGRTQDGILYYVMEYLPGLSLARLIEMEGAIAPARVIYILRQVCGSLAEAHDVGLVHRDIKPSNIMLSIRGGLADFTKVLDFGLVKDLRNPEQPDMTALNQLPGTPAYMAPERLKNPAQLDARCDIYSVGAMAFKLLTGRPLFRGRSAIEIAFHIVRTPPRTPSTCVKQSIPAPLDQLIIRCLAKDPKERPASAAEMIDVFDTITDAGHWGQAEAKAWWARNAQRISALRATPDESVSRPTRRAQPLTIEPLMGK